METLGKEGILMYRHIISVAAAIGLALALVLAAAQPARALAMAAQALPAGAVGLRPSAADPRAVATARAFMAAFVRRDYQGKVRLMSARLIARNHSATVAQ